MTTQRRRRKFSASMDEPSTLTIPASRQSSLLLAAGLALIASVVLFPSLGRSAMEPDESLYALATDQIRESGEWWTLSPTPPHPYFNKPPLYMWLTATTYDLLPGFEFKYRFWSAVFGIVAVVMTGLLGARLFRWEVGAIAGMLLLTNRSFLIDHGTRFGGMDAGLTACYAAMLWIYWPGKSVSLRRWAAIGVISGVASMLKPLGGVPMLLVILVIAIARRDRVGWRSLLAGPWRISEGGRHGQASTLAHATRTTLAVCLPLFAVAAPWYVINHFRYPDQFASHLFGQQIAGAIGGGGDLPGDRPWHFYLTAVPRSSRHFLLLIPAMVWLAVMAWRRREQRSAAGFLAVAGIGWIALISVAEKKFLHYAYPAFVPLAIAMGGMIIDAAYRISCRLQYRSLARWLSNGVVVLLAGFAGWLAVARLEAMSDPSGLWETYRRSEAGIRSGQVSVLLVDVPAKRGDRWSDGQIARPQMSIYLTHMHGQRGGDAELRAVLASPTPVLIILPANKAATLNAKENAVRRYADRYLVAIELNQ